MADITPRKKKTFLVAQSHAALGGGQMDLEDIATQINNFGAALAEASGDGTSPEPSAQVINRLIDENGGTHTIVAEMTEAVRQQLEEQHGGNLIIEEDLPLSLLDDGAFLDPDQIHLQAMMPASDELKIVIKVVDEDDKAVPKARVTLAGGLWVESGVTNNSGRVTLSMFGETLGTLTLLMVKPSTGFWGLRMADPDLKDNQENVVRLTALGAFFADGQDFPDEQMPGWGIEDMGLTTPSDPTAAVKLAVIDSGIAGSHPDLDAVEGFDFGETGTPEESWTTDGSGHGTHVAGMCAGLNNEVGIRGFAPKSNLVGLRIFPEARTSKLLAALDWCIANQVDVVNMSLGGPSKSETMRQRLRACRDKGILLIAAAGNNGGAVLFPAAYPEVMAVAAIGKIGSFPETSAHQGQIGDGTSTNGQYFTAKFTCHGPEIDVCGPGVAIISSVPPKGYAAWDGTSMACPHVAGLAARLLQQNEEIRKMPRTQARSTALWDKVIGSCVDLGMDAEFQGAGLPALSGSVTPVPTDEVDSGSIAELRQLLDQAIAIVEQDLQDA